MLINDRTIQKMDNTGADQKLNSKKKVEKLYNTEVVQKLTSQKIVEKLYNVPENVQKQTTSQEKVGKLIEP